MAAKRLHLGSGGMVLPGYLNTDFDELEGVDLALDASKIPYPFEDNTLDEIFSAHMIEHIDPTAVPAMIAEWHRILKPGGRAIVECPDLDDALRRYAAGTYSRDKLLALIYGNHERPTQRHQWGYGFGTLAHLFTTAGFSDVTNPPTQDYHWINIGIPTFRLEATK